MVPVNKSWSALCSVLPFVLSLTQRCIHTWPDCAKTNSNTTVTFAIVTDCICAKKAQGLSLSRMTKSKHCSQLGTILVSHLDQAGTAVLNTKYDTKLDRTFPFGRIWRPKTGRISLNFWAVVLCDWALIKSILKIKWIHKIILYTIRKGILWTKS
jgi:hypothetical protein